MNLDNIRIVLVKTFHPGNIGSAARAMKTMGLSDLALVNPRDFPSEEANKMAAGAEDVLQSATLHSSLLDAVADCRVVIASTSRVRSYDLPELEPEKMAEKLLDGSQDDPVALIFGPERMGLHNSDMQHAKYRVTIPANPEYYSLNMASAVQLLSYEIHRQWRQSSPLTTPAIPSTTPSTNTPGRSAPLPNPLPTQEDTERFYTHLESTLRLTQFLRPHSGETMQRLRNLFARAEPSAHEMNILRGFLRSIETSIKR